MSADNRLGRIGGFLTAVTFSSSVLAGCSSSLDAKPSLVPAPTPTPNPNLIVDCERGPLKGRKNLDADIGEKVIFQAQITAKEGIVELELTPQDRAGFGWNLQRNSSEQYSVEITDLHSFNVIMPKLKFTGKGDQVGNKVTGNVTAICANPFDQTITS